MGAEKREKGKEGKFARDVKGFEQRSTIFGFCSDGAIENGG